MFCYCPERNPSRHLTCELFTPLRQINPENNPVPIFSHLVEELRRRHPNFGYLHVIEPCVRDVFDRGDRGPEEESNDFLRDIWAGKPWMSAGSFSRESALKQADEKGELIAFGRYFDVVELCGSALVTTHLPEHAASHPTLSLTIVVLESAR